MKAEEMAGRGGRDLRLKMGTGQAVETSWEGEGKSNGMASAANGLV